ncbi:hypothetical protein AAG906_025584 [Vitis piasezkii]
MKPAIGKTYMSLPTAKDVWDAIRETYSDAKNASQIFELKTRLWQMKQGDREVTEYYTEMLAFEFLAGLNRELDDVRSRVFNRQSLPSIREVFSEVRHEESRRKVLLREYLTSGPEASALVTRGPHARSSPRQSKRTYCEHLKIANGTLSPIAGKGSICIYESITLNPVLHDLSSGKMIGSAKEREGLYYLTKLMCVGRCPPRFDFQFWNSKDACQQRGSSSHSRRASLGEAAHKCLFLGLINSISILKCIHIVYIKLFKPPRLSFKIRSSLCIPDGRRMGYQGWLKVGLILMPMNPNSEEGGYACREHKHKVKPPKEIEGLRNLGSLDLGSDGSSLQFCCSTCPPVNENYHIKCKFLDGDQSKLFSGEEATIPPMLGPWMVELDETGNPDLI